MEEQDVSFIFNAQHDCSMLGCEASALQPRIQECQTTDQMEKLVSHKDNDHFVINMFGLHNAMLLCQALPPHLAEITALYDDRQAHHDQLAAKVRVSQTAKQARMQEKRKATTALNKAKKMARQAEIDAHDVEEVEHNDHSELESEDNELDEDDDNRPAKRPRVQK